MISRSMMLLKPMKWSKSNLNKRVQKGAQLTIYKKTDQVGVFPNWTDLTYKWGAAFHNSSKRKQGDIMANYRVGRVAQEIQREVNDIIRKRVRDPRVQGINITDVRVTGDLQQATIFYSTLSDEEKDVENAQLGLDKATGLIRKELGQRLSIYKTPELMFERDESVAYGNRIDELLRDLNKD